MTSISLTGISLTGTDGQMKAHCEQEGRTP